MARYRSQLEKLRSCRPEGVEALTNNWNLTMLQRGRSRQSALSHFFLLGKEVNLHLPHIYPVVHKRIILRGIHHLPRCDWPYISGQVLGYINTCCVCLVFTGLLRAKGTSQKGHWRIEWMRKYPYIIPLHVAGMFHLHFQCHESKWGSRRIFMGRKAAAAGGNVSLNGRWTYVHTVHV